MDPTTRTAVLILGLTFCAFAGLQAQAPAAGAAPEAAAAVHHKTLWEQIKEGGWVMVPIGLCSVLTLYLIGDGILRTSPKKVLPEEHVAAVKSFFRQGDYVGAYNYCKAHPSPFTNVCRVAVSLLGEGRVCIGAARGFLDLQPQADEHAAPRIL